LPIRREVLQRASNVRHTHQLRPAKKLDYTEPSTELDDESSETGTDKSTDNGEIDEEDRDVVVLDDDDEDEEDCEEEEDDDDEEESDEKETSSDREFVVADDNGDNDDDDDDDDDDDHRLRAATAKEPRKLVNPCTTIMTTMS
jgi:hypothetical protein